MKIKHICDACLLNDNDRSIKEVEFCEFCQAYLCNMCLNSPMTRLEAMARKKGKTIEQYMTSLKDWLKSKKA